MKRFRTDDGPVVVSLAFLVAALLCVCLLGSRQAHAEEADASVPLVAQEASDDIAVELGADGDVSDEATDLGDISSFDDEGTSVELGADGQDESVDDDENPNANSLQVNKEPDTDDASEDGEDVRLTAFAGEYVSLTDLFKAPKAPRMSFSVYYMRNTVSLGKTYTDSFKGDYLRFSTVNASSTGYYNFHVKSTEVQYGAGIYNKSGKLIAGFGPWYSGGLNQTKKIKLSKGTYYFVIITSLNKSQMKYSYSVSAVPTWSGASRLPLSATADVKVSNGGYIRLKSGGRWVTSNSVLSLSAPSSSTKRMTARGTGSTTLYLLDAAGNQVASKKVTVYSIASGKWEIQSSVNKNYVLDIRGRSKANGARMIVWKRNNQNNQRYQFQRQSDGTYLIRCCHSGRYVDVQGGGTRRSQAVIQWGRNARDNQRWRISVDASNRVTFTCKKSGMCFDIQGGKVTSRAQMIQWPSNGRSNQKWVLNKK